jgi:hypothetical protein
MIPKTFVPESVKFSGMKLALAPDGNPLRSKFTTPLPFVATRTFVKLTLFPASTDWDDGEVTTAKFPTDARNERLFVHTPSVTEIVMSEIPVTPAAGVMVSVRLIPLPPMTRFASGISVWFDDVAKTCNDAPAVEPRFPKLKLNGPLEFPGRIF